jgi:hypothetical protein
MTKGCIMNGKKSRHHRLGLAAGAAGLIALTTGTLVIAEAAAANAATTTTKSMASAASTPPGKPPGNGMSGGAGAPGGNSSSAAVTGTGSYTMSGGSATKTGSAISASNTDESGVLVKKAGTLVLNKVNVATSGKSSSSDDSSFYGLDSGVLALAGSKISESGGSVSTTGDGANAIFAYGTGASVDVSGTKVTATGQYAHGIMASGGGSITATKLTVSTSGASSAAVATDRGGGTIKVVGGTYRTSGHNSPGIYSTGTIVARNAKFTATGAEAVVVEGSNSVTVKNSVLVGSKNRGVMLYQSFSGDASGSSSRFTDAGGSLTALDGPLFYVTNTSATISLNNVALNAKSGVLVNASAGAWGTTGSNGGNVTLKASDEKLVGSIIVDKVSTATIRLAHGTTLTGAIDTADTAKKVTLSLDSTSKWTVTANSHITVLSDTSGISGTRITNIVGNGHTVYYDSSANPSLGGKTFSLVGGGTLQPE